MARVEALGEAIVEGLDLVYLVSLMYLMSL